MKGTGFRELVIGLGLACAAGCGGGENEEAEGEDLAELRQRLVAMEKQLADGERERPGVDAVATPGGAPVRSVTPGAAGAPEGVGAPAGVAVPRAIPNPAGPLGDANWRLERAKEDLEVWDEDRDGALSEDEYLARYVDRHRRRFANLDADQDGKLSAEELAAPPTLTLPPLPRGGAEPVPGGKSP